MLVTLKLLQQYLKISTFRITMPTIQQLWESCLYRCADKTLSVLQDLFVSFTICLCPRAMPRLTSASVFRSSDSTKCGGGGATAVSRQWAGAGRAEPAALARRPPAAPRPRVSASGSQRSLLSVASEGRATSRPPPRHYPHPLVDSGFSLFVSGRFASNTSSALCWRSSAPRMPTHVSCQGW